MSKAKQIHISKTLLDHLGLSQEDIQTRLEIMVEKRMGQSKEQLFDDTITADDYLNTFTPQEIVALFITVASEAGFLEYKLNKIILAFGLPLEAVKRVIEEEIDPKDITDLYKDDPTDEDDDFV